MPAQQNHFLLLGELDVSDSKPELIESQFACPK
jgi:hypothetical protein